jgi:hypothetical protein
MAFNGLVTDDIGTTQELLQQYISWQNSLPGRDAMLRELPLDKTVGLYALLETDNCPVQVQMFSDWLEKQHAQDPEFQVPNINVFSYRPNASDDKIIETAKNKARFLDLTLD